MINIIHFYSKTKVLLSLGGQSFEFSKLKHLSLQEFTTLYISVFPLEYENICCPYQFVIANKNNEISSISKNIKIFKIKEDEYFILLETLFQNNLLLHQDNYLVTNGLQVYYNSSLLANERFYANYCDIFEINNLTFLNLCSMEYINKNPNLLIVLKKDKVLLQKEYTSLELTNSTLTLLTNCKDSLMHGIVNIYNLSKDEIFLTDSFSVYLDKNNLPNVEYINPVNAFLDCGICGNENLIKKFISKDLYSNFTIDNFNQFFNYPSSYYVIGNNNNIMKVIVLGKNEYDIFNFEIEDNIIKKIENKK